MIIVPGAVTAAVKSGAFKYAWLVELPDGLYFTNHAVDLVHDGKTYLANGGLLSVPAITRDREIKENGASLTFADEDGLLSAALRARNLTGETCAIRQVFLDDGGAIIAGFALGVSQGTFHNWIQRTTSKQDHITVKFTGGFSRPAQTAGRITSNNNQQDLFAGDDFFEFAHENRDHLGWGREA